MQLMLKCWSSLYIIGINIALSNPIASVFSEQYLLLLFSKEIPFLKILVGDNIPEALKDNEYTMGEYYFNYL